MKIRYPLIILLLLISVFKLNAQNENVKLRKEIGDKVNYIIIHSEKFGKDSIYFVKLEELNSLLKIYKKEVGFNIFYSDNSILYARETISKNPALSLRIFEENIIDATSKKLEKALFVNYHELANLYFGFGNTDKAAEYYLKAANIKRHDQDWSEYAYALVDLGNLYFNSKQYDVSLYYYNKAKDIFLKHEKSNQLDYFLALYYNNIGLIYIEKMDPSIALKNFRIAYQIRIKSDRINLYPHSYLYFVRAFNLMKNNDSSNFYYLKAIEIQENKSLYEELITTYISFGDFLEENADYDEALKYYQKAANIAIIKGFKPSLSEIYYTTALLFRNLNQRDSVYKYITLSNTFANNYNQTKFKELTTRALMNLYEIDGDYKKAIYYYKIYLNLLNETNRFNTLEKEVQLQLDERKREEALSKEIAERNRRIIFNQNLALILLVLIIIISIYAGFRIRKQKNLLEETIRHRDLIYSIIAHDLRGPLSGVYSGIDLIEKEEIDDEDTKMQILRTAQSTFRSTFVLLENLLEWANYQSNKTVFLPKNHNIRSVIQSSIQIVDSMAIKKDIKIKTVINEDFYAFIDKFMLTSVLRNILSNAIKFSKNNSEIIVLAENEGKFIKLTVQDFGMGMKPEIVNRITQSNESFSTLGTNREKGSGLGLQIIRDFLKRNNGYLKVESQIGVGTKFIIFLPEAKKSK
jgi:signal transduction histidine kinase